MSRKTSGPQNGPLAGQFLLHREEAAEPPDQGPGVAGGLESLDTEPIFAPEKIKLESNPPTAVLPWQPMQPPML